MALVTPIAQPRTAFDARDGARFDFVIDDSGDRIVASYIEILRQSDNTRVYWKKQESAQRYFNILPDDPNYNLTNGTYYSFRVKTYNAQGQESLWSDKVQFYCYSTPVITMENLPTALLPVIETNNFEFKFSYSQAEGELMNYIRMDISVITTDEHGEEHLEGVYTSGNILANEDNEYSAMVYGLINDSIYVLDVTGVTVNGTEFSLHEQLGYYQRFTIHSEVPEYYSQIEVEPKCDKGYVDITANLVVTDGEALYEPQYVGDDHNKQIILLPRHSWVKWTQGFSIQQAFTMGIWGKIGQEGQILGLWNIRNQVNIKMYYRRGYMTDISDCKDFIELNAFDNDGNVMLKMISNQLDPLKPNESYFVFFQIKDLSTINLQLIKTVTADFEWSWNLPAEVYFGQMMPTNWVNEEWKHYDYASTDAGQIILTPYYNQSTMQEMIPLTCCQIQNGVFDQIDITNDVDITPETYVPEWTTKTILDADFNGNISGGNTDMILSEVGYLRIKRRQFNSNIWITLKEIPVNKPEDFKIEYIDTCIPSGIEQIYAIVPVDPNGQETSISTYITKSTGEFKWNGVFVSMGTDIMRFFSQVQYNSLVKNRQIGTFQPLSSKYPVVVQNAATSYLSGTLSALVLGEDWEEHRGYINRQAVVAQLTKIHEWLDRGEAVVLKDWNGWILICRSTSGDNVSFSANYGNGVATASFNFVEQGKYDNQEDLYEAGIIDFKG